MPPRHSSLPSAHPTTRLVGQSPAIQVLQAQIRTLVPFDTVGNRYAPTVLLQGDTGTGKGLVARIIHDSGPRAQGAYIEVNCAAIPEAMLEAELFGFEVGAFTDARRAKPGLFEAAVGGTLFLDEIDSLPLVLQAKLLTAIEEKRTRRLGAVTTRQVDVKVITATQADLAEQVVAGRFRADLYHRLTVVLLRLPSLRVRGKDILVLAEHFLQHYAAVHQVSPRRLTRAAQDWLLTQAWPGNVREISHLMERATLLHSGLILDVQTLESLCLTPLLPLSEQAPEDYQPLDEVARLQQALVEAKGSVVGAARLLGLSRSAMRYRMQRAGLGRFPSPGAPAEVPGEDAIALAGPPLVDASAALRSGQKPVVLLALSLTLPYPHGSDIPAYEPWTTAHGLEQSMVEKVQGFGGVVLPGPLGLRLVAFGLPRALEQMPHRAVQAALALRQAVAETVNIAGDTLGAQVRLAIDLGEVLADTQTSPPPGDVLILGDTLTRMMRLVGLAEPGDILLTPRVARGVHAWFTLQARELTQPYESPDGAEIYAVLGLRSHQASWPKYAPLSRFVGRERELALLHEALTQVMQGHGQVVGLVGEPGVGKSRLLAEFCQQVTTRSPMQGLPVLCLEGRCVAYGSTMPYLPVRNLLRGYFGLDEHGDVQTIRTTLTDALGALDPSLIPLCPALLTLLDVPVDDELWHALEPEQRRQRLLDAARRLPLFASQKQPLVMVIEDAHWIDETSQAFLETLIDSLPAARLLLLVSYRPEYHHNWGSKSHYTHLRLDPFKPAEARVFLTTLLGDDGIAPPSLSALSDLLIEQAAGNPFFLEESVLTLRETHILVRERETYRLAQAVSTLQVPTTVQAALAARIDWLPPVEKHLLQLAAVIGADVPMPVLAAVGGLSEDALHPALSHLQQAGFLYEARLFPEQAYAFKHPLIHEIIYRSLFEQDRQRCHAAVGHYLETSSGNHLDGTVDLLAHHFGRSVEDDKAVEYAIRAAEKAQQRWANHTTLAYLEAAVARLATMPDTQANRLHKIDAVLRQGEARFAQGQHTEHMTLLEGIRTVVDEAADPRYRASWTYWMGFFHVYTGSPPDIAIAYCRDASVLAEAGGFDDIQAIADACLAQAYVCAGDFQEAVTAGERALALFEVRGYVWWACRTLWQLIQAANALGDWPRSLEYCHRAFEYGQTVDDLRLKVVAWWRTGSTHIQRGDPKQGLECCEEALALSPSPFDAVMVKAVRGHGLVKVGQVEAGIVELKAAVAWYEQLHFRYTRSVFALRLGEAHLRQNAPAQARALFEEVLATSQKAGHRYLAGMAARFLGEALVSEEPAAAATHLAEAVQILQMVGARNELAKAWVAQADLLVGAGRIPDARALLARALDLFKTLGTVDEPCRVQATLITLQTHQCA